MVKRPTSRKVVPSQQKTKRHYRRCKNDAINLEKTSPDEFTSTKHNDTPQTSIEIFPNCVEAPQKINIKRWNEKETNRLKLAIRAVGNPQSLADWQYVADCVSGGHRSAEECRERAVKLRYFKPVFIVGDGRRNSKKCNDDFFANRTCDDTVFDLNMNDSLLSVLNTPPNRVRFKRRPVLLRQVFDETHFSNEPGGSTELK